MADWGTVLAFEAQEWVYYALAGNIAINNCFNAHALHVAVGANDGTIGVPSLDPRVPANFGGLELKAREGSVPAQELGAPVDRENLISIRVMTLDSLNLKRVDFLKIDVEGMEIDVINGSLDLIRQNKPILYVEWVKSEQDKLAEGLTALGYDKLFKFGMNLIAVHPDDPCRESINFEQAPK
jgi:FkbM family methyltransferase